MKSALRILTAVAISPFVLIVVFLLTLYELGVSLFYFAGTGEWHWLD